MRRVGGLALAVTLGGIAAGCGTSKSGSTSTTKSTSTATTAAARTVDDQQVEQGIQSSLSTSSVKVTKASCPPDVPVQSGGTFSCSVTFSNGATGKVTVTQKGAGRYSYAVTPGSVQIPGSEVDQQIEAQLAKQGIS